MSYRRDEGGAGSIWDESHRTHDWWDITKDHEWNSLSIFIFNIFMAKKIVLIYYTETYICLMSSQIVLWHEKNRKYEKIYINCIFTYISKWKYCLV